MSVLAGMTREERVTVEAYRALSSATDTGGAIVLRAPEAPDSPMLNRVVGLGTARPATEPDIDRALAVMGTGLAFYVAVNPGARPPELPEWLYARGLRPGWGWMAFRRGVRDAPPVQTSLRLIEANGRPGRRAVRTRRAEKLPATGGDREYDRACTTRRLAVLDRARRRRACRGGRPLRGRRSGLPRPCRDASRAPRQGCAKCPAGRPYPARRGTRLPRRAHGDRRAKPRSAEQLLPQHPPSRLRGNCGDGELAPTAVELQPRRAPCHALPCAISDSPTRNRPRELRDRIEARAKWCFSGPRSPIGGFEKSLAVATPASRRRIEAPLLDETAPFGAR